MKPEGIEYSDVLSDVDVILDRRQAENNLDLSKPKCILNPHFRWMWFPDKSIEADKQPPSQPKPMFKKWAKTQFSQQHFHDFVVVIWSAKYLAN